MWGKSTEVKEKTWMKDGENGGKEVERFIEKE